MPDNRPDAQGDVTVEPTSRSTRLSDFPRLVLQVQRLVWSSARREFLVIASLELLQGGGIAAQLLVGRRVLSSLLGAAESGAGFRSVVPVLALLVGVTVVLSFAAAVQVEQSRVLGDLVARRASERVLDVAGSVDLAAFERPGFFDRLQRARVAALTRPVEMVEGLGTLVTSVVTLAGIAVVLVALQPVIALFLFVGYLPLWYAATRNSRALYEFALSITEEDRRRTYLERLLCGRNEAKEIRAFQLGELLRERYDRLYDERISKLRHVAGRRMRRSLLAALGSSGLTAACLGLLSYLYVADRLSLPTLGVAIAGLLQLGAKLRGVTAGAGALYESALFIDDYESFLRLSPGPRPGPGESAALAPFQRLVAEGLTFTYPGAKAPALLDVSLQIGQGEVVALVGRNGSGKTTLATLLACLYVPDEGHITWDGVDLGTVEPDAARASIAVIFQDFVRYLLPARENIGAGRHARLHDGQAIVDAACAAGADAFIARLPHGYDTVLGKEFKDGTDLSIGEWQRLALARAFFRNAPFVILDEPTSAIDAAAEQELFERISSLFEHRSVLLISHRFSSVRSADRIYVLDRGRIVEQGSHEELMAQRGLYATLFTAQAAAYAPRPTSDR